VQFAGGGALAGKEDYRVAEDLECRRSS
jgi:hypothetical protein